MATASVFARESETALRRTPFASKLPVAGVARIAGIVLVIVLDSPCHAAPPLPGAPTDATERAWYTTFMTRFNARVVPSFRVDPTLEQKVAHVWDEMVQRLAGGKGIRPTPLDQYPLLSFVDDQFLVMKVKTPGGHDSYVVRGDDAGAEVPTLTSTLEEYLDGVIYPSLVAIAEEEKEKIDTHPEYEPRLLELSAQNPFQHGLPIRVPEMGPFKNRMIVFTGYGGRLTTADTAQYEQQKWDAGERRVVGVMRDHQWGLAVELADLVEDGQVICHYRTVREVSAVKDTFVGSGRRGVLLRQPRLGAIVEVSGCQSGCDDGAGWKRIYPDAAARSAPRARRPMMPPVLPGDAVMPTAAEPGPVSIAGEIAPPS